MHNHFLTTSNLENDEKNVYMLRPYMCTTILLEIFDWFQFEKVSLNHFFYNSSKKLDVAKCHNNTFWVLWLAFTTTY
jgi:hypothetical protein